MPGEIHHEAEPTRPSEVISVWPNEIVLFDIDDVVNRLSQPGESLYLYDEYDLQGPVSGGSIRINNDNGLFRAFGEIRLAPSANPSHLQNTFMEKTKLVDSLDNSANYPSFADASITARPLSNAITVYSHVSSLESFVVFQTPKGPTEGPRVRIATDYSTKDNEYVSPPKVEDIDLPSAIRDFLKLWLSTVNTLVTCDDPQAIPQKLETFNLEMSRHTDQASNVPEIAKLAISKAKLTSVTYQKMQEAMAKLREKLQESETIQPGLELSDIGGMVRAKELARSVINSFNSPEAYKRWGVPRPRGVLLHGPTGTGKTILAKAIANELRADLRQISPAEIPGKWLGESEANMQRIFDEVRVATEPTVLLFEDLDQTITSIGRPTSGADHVRQAVAAIFKKEMDNLSDTNANVLVIATTKNIDAIEPDLISPGRFQTKIPLSYPTEAERREIWSIKIAGLISKFENDGFKMFNGDLDVAALAKYSDGMSGADIKVCLDGIRQQKAGLETNGQIADSITQDEIKSAIYGFYR